MTRTVLRWVIVAAAVLLLVGLVAYARGEKHHHGDDVGSHGVKITVVRR